MKKNSISDAELEVMEVLWQSAIPMSAYEIRQRLNERNQWERTTVLTLIRRMVDKRIISQEKREVYYYAPLIKREEFQKEETRNFIKKIYKGNSKELVAALFQDQELSRKDVEELKIFFNGNGAKD